MSCEETGELFAEEDLTIEEFHRFEGTSDPDESAIVYLLVSQSSIRGTLVDSFGAQANAELAAFLSAIPIDRSETQKPESKKFCLNCRSELTGSYCAQCGQKDEHLREPFWKLAAHFTGDFFHFDSKFTRTFGPLLWKPGFLTSEFNSGRRARYMKPVQLYIFISLTFFLAYFSFGNKPGSTINEIVKVTPDSTSAQEKLTDSAAAKAPGDWWNYLPQPAKDSLLQKMKRDQETERRKLAGDTLPPSSSETMVLHEEGGVKFTLTDDVSLPETVAEYEEQLKKIPPAKRPSWWQIAINKRQIELNERARKDRNEVFSDLFDSFTHGIPKLVFLLLPIFALILKLLYIRRHVYFVDHAIFSLHFHSFLFLFFLIVLLIHLVFPGLISIDIICLISFIYLLLALKRLYRESWAKSTAKALGLLFFYFFAMILVSLIGIFYSVMTA